MYKIDRVKVQMLMLQKWGGVEQRKLAVRMDVTEATISRLLTGTHSFSAESLTKLCQALECTPNDILTFVPDEPERERPYTQAQAPTQAEKRQKIPA